MNKEKSFCYNCGKLTEIIKVPHLDDKDRCYFCKDDYSPKLFRGFIATKPKAGALL